MGLGFDPIAEAGRNWERRGWAETDAMLAATSITRAHQILQSRIDAALAPFDLNFSRFEVLALLTFSRAGRLPMGKIGDRLQVHAASVTNTTRRLERSGFVERVTAVGDGRIVLARILPAGRRVATRAATALAEIEFGLDGMSPTARREITDSLVAYRRANHDFD